MYQSSEEQVFARIERIRRKAVRLIHGESADAEAETETEWDVAAPGDEFFDAESVGGVEMRLPRLAALFDISPLGVDALICLLAAEYDPFLRTLMRAVQRELGRPWMEIGTVAELLGLPTPEVPELASCFALDGTLRRWALVQCDDPTGIDTPQVITRVKISSRIAQYLVGRDTVPEGIQVRHAAPEAIKESLVPSDTVRAVLSRLERASVAYEPIVVEVTGSPGTGRRFFAEAIAGELGQPAIVADLSLVDKRHLADRLAEVRREARLLDGVVCLANWNFHTTGGTPMGGDENGAGPPPTTVPRHLEPAMVKFLDEHEDLLFVIAEEREPLLSQHISVIVNVEVPFPSPMQRASLLEEAIKRLEAQTEPDIDFSNVSRRFALDPSRIRIAARQALELAVEEDPENRLITAAQLQEACRHQLRHDLKSLAQRVTAAHKWEDLVVPVDVYHSLREMVMYVKHAGHVYDEWGFGGRLSVAQGISALFAGPPGTGKTMCASVIARELDMELFRVDLSRVVSKWIGETEKNLGRVFDEAQRSNAIILFDEADSLFAKRTDVKSSVDRYANLEVNFLLQRMENFSGVTVLTTNFEDTIDTAFKRRLTFRMRFEKPDADARAALWKKMFPSSAPLSDDIDYARLGKLYELSGGHIRNAVVRSAFLAAPDNRPIDMLTCMMAAEREAREMGVLVKSAIQPGLVEQRRAQSPSFRDVSAEEAHSNRPPQAGAEEALEDEDFDAEEASAEHDLKPARNGKDKPSRVVPITHPRKPR